MDHYHLLLDAAMKLGYRLAMSGAETYRIEESITRILTAYHVVSETFSIPNCLIVSVKGKDGKPITRMRRIGYHGNDLDSVERYSNLSRRICLEKPDPETLLLWLGEEDKKRKIYHLPMLLLGYFLGSLGFCIFFGGSLRDSLCAGFCGVLAGLANRSMGILKVNPFFSSIASAFLLVLSAYLTAFLQLCSSVDAVIIGSLMILMPGLIFTNALRDLIFGDTNSGINRIVQMMLIASAVALGTGTASGAANYLFGIIPGGAALSHPYWLQCVAGTVGCIGFSILFNIHGPGGILCALGGFITWAAYCFILDLDGGIYTANFIASIFAGIYSETMARIRKFPAISYLVISIFPLIPGAGIYYTSRFLANSALDQAVDKGLETVGITGAIAVGILVVSTIVRHWYLFRIRLNKTRKK